MENVNSRTLNELIRNHSALLQGDAPLVKIVAKIREESLAMLGHQFYVDLLAAIVHYHEQHQLQQQKEQPDWQESYRLFASFIVTPEDEAKAKQIGLRIKPLPNLVLFYVHNYCFLALRNANGDQGVIEDHFKKAMAVTRKIPPPVRHQLRGFIVYNHSRLLLKQKQMDAAKKEYMQASEARVKWYEHVRDSGTDADAVKGAATQVWKMRKDWPGFFGNDPDELPITPALFEEVAKLADPNFSATK